MPVRGFDQEEEEDDEDPPPTIMIASGQNEEALSVDERSQRITEGRFHLQFQADEERLTIPELTERAQKVIGALEQQIPDGGHRWLITDKKTADVWRQRGLLKRCIRSIACDFHLDGLATMPKGTEMRDIEMGEAMMDAVSRVLTQGMSGIALSGAVVDDVSRDLIQRMSGIGLGGL
jgi:hypothetical protein